MIISAGTTERLDGYEYTRRKNTIDQRFSAGYLHRGMSRRTTNGQTVVRKAPSFSISKPGGVFHTVTAPVRSRYLAYWVVFAPRPEWRRLLDWPDTLPGSVIIDLPKGRVTEAIHYAFRELLAVSKSVHPEKEALMDNLLEQILLELHSLHATHKGRLLDERLQQGVEFMNTHLREKVTLEDIAAATHLSASRFAHLFSETLGVSPMKHLEAQRIEAAKALLLTSNDPVYAVAQKVGFENPFHFSSRFRRRVGQSPRDFREGKTGT
jgi:AraC family transcriptional regulator of arabinose operon